MPKHLPATLLEACAHLSNVDPVMGQLIREVGDCQLHLQGARYSVLVRSIISQQISVQAAKTIRKRLQRSLSNRHLSPRTVAALSDTDFKTIGLSRQKRGYLRHLTELTLNGTLNFRSIARNPNDESIISALVEVNGIGKWTAQMFLVFGLGRLDVFASGDLGLRKAVATHYNLPTSATSQDYEALALQWSPFRSIASWYLWRSLEM